MSEIYDDISRDGNKNIKYENTPKIKNNSQLQMHIEYPPPPSPAEVRPSVPQMLSYITYISQF